MADSIYTFEPVAGDNSALDSIPYGPNQLYHNKIDDLFRAYASKMAQYVDDLGAVNTVGGTGNAITVTLASGITAYATGQHFRFIAANGNTGATTINVNSIGAKAVRKISGGTDAALASGDIAAGETYLVRYDAAANGAAGAWIIVGAASVAAATTSAAGIVELATTAETETGTDATRAVTPDGLHDMTTLAGAAWFLDEDDMASNSATKTASQQSIKAYVDTKGITLGTPVASTSGTSIDFTGIPSWAKSITVNFVGVSTNGTSPIAIQLGDSGGIETTGYSGVSLDFIGGSTANPTTGFGVSSGNNAAALWHGFIELKLEKASSNTWTCSGTLGRSDTGQGSIVNGSKSLSATLDRIRITTLGGTNTFDAGELNVSWE